MSSTTPPHTSRARSGSPTPTPPPAAAARTSTSSGSHPPSSIRHFSAHFIGFMRDDTPQIILEPVHGDFTMLIGRSCAAYHDIHHEASRILAVGSRQTIRMAFETAPGNFGRLDVVPGGSGEDEGGPSRSRMERQGVVAASGQGLGQPLRRLTVVNGEAEPDHQVLDSIEDYFGDGTQRSR